MNKVKIFLVGMPGSGKSSIGKVLSTELSLPFFDLDEIVETNVDMTITEMFESKGEDFFRINETKALREFVQIQEAFVLATGGGTPCYDDNMVYMNKNGITVYIEAALKMLFERISRKTNRPLLRNNPEATLEQLLLERHPVYSKAELRVIRDLREKDVVALEIAQKVQDLS